MIQFLKSLMLKMTECGMVLLRKNEILENIIAIIFW